MREQNEGDVPDINLFKSRTRKNWYFWFTNPITGLQENKSARTNNKKDAKRFAEAYVRRAFGCDASTKSQLILLSGLSKSYQEYQTGHGRKVKTITTTRDSFNQLIKSVGDIPLSSLTYQACDNFIYQDTPSKHTALKHYTGLSTAFKFAVKHQMIVCNPFEMIERPRLKEYEKKVDWFNKEDFHALLNKLPDRNYYDQRIRNMVIMAFYTGLRLGELRHLQIRHIVLNEPKPCIAITNIAVPTLPKEQAFTTKNGSDRIVPLCQKAIDAINAQIEGNQAHKLTAIRDSIYLFPSERGTPLSESGATNKYRKHVKRTFPNRGLCFHSLRHGYGTMMVLQGMPPYVVQTNMGHSNITTTERYWHFADLDFSMSMSGLDSPGSKKNYLEPSHFQSRPIITLTRGFAISPESESILKTMIRTPSQTI